MCSFARHRKSGSGDRCSVCERIRELIHAESETRERQ